MDNQVHGGGFPLSRCARGLLGLWSLLLLGGFALAWMLPPDPDGFGTHRRLGLPACTFRVEFGIPCPSCGMTTSFAHFVRGQFVQAARANFAGLLLAVVCLVQIPWIWISVYRGRLVGIERPELLLMWILIGFCVAGLAQWGVRLRG